MSRRRKEDFSLRKIHGEKRFTVNWTSIMCQALKHMVWINHFISFKQGCKIHYLQSSIWRLEYLCLEDHTSKSDDTCIQSPSSYPPPPQCSVLTQKKVLLAVTYSSERLGAKEHEVDQCRHELLSQCPELRDATNAAPSFQTRAFQKFIPRRELSKYFSSSKNRLDSWVSAQNCF